MLVITSFTKKWVFMNGIVEHKSVWFGNRIQKIAELSCLLSCLLVTRWVEVFCAKNALFAKKLLKIISNCFQSCILFYA